MATCSVSFAHGFDFALSGRASARGLGYAYDRLNIENATASAALNASPERVTLSGIQATALGAQITGRADLVHHREFHFQGNLDGLEVRQGAAVFTSRPIPWNGVLSGPFEADAILGQAQAKVHAQAVIVAASQGMPIEGRIEVGYDQQTATIRFGDSHVNTPATSVTLSGTLGGASSNQNLLDQNLDVRARTTSLDDVLTALSMAGDAAPRTLPLQFNRSGGEASLAGVLTGRLADPEFRGEVAVSNASVQGHGFDRLNGDIQASRRSVALRRMTISRGQTQIAGDVALAANGGASGGDFATGPLTAQLSVKNASLAEAARELGLVTDAQGTASATLRLSGTARDPQAEAAFDAIKVTALGEQAERVRGNLRYTARSLAVSGGQADLVEGKLLFDGAFEHPAEDFKNGDVRADVTAQGVVFSRVAALHKLQPGIEARLDGKAAVEARVERGTLQVRSVSGAASARSVTLDKETLGDVNVSAATSGNELALQAKAQLRGNRSRRSGQVAYGRRSPRLGDFPVPAPQRGRAARFSDAARHSRSESGGAAP